MSLIFDAKRTTRGFAVAIVLLVLAPVAYAQNKCSASGQMGGEKFAMAQCAAAVYEHSIAIWFNEAPIAAAEAQAFAESSYADEKKDGKQRTLAVIMFCPGGGAATASAGAVKSVDLHTNHAKSPFLGMQTVVEAPKELKVEKLGGEIKPGGSVTGKFSGSSGETKFNFEFDVKLPAKESAAGMSCP